MGFWTVPKSVTLSDLECVKFTKARSILPATKDQGLGTQGFEARTRSWPRDSISEYVLLFMMFVLVNSGVAEHLKISRVSRRGSGLKSFQHLFEDAPVTEVHWVVNGMSFGQSVHQTVVLEGESHSVTTDVIGLYSECVFDRIPKRHWLCAVSFMSRYSSPSQNGAVPILNELLYCVSKIVTEFLIYCDIFLINF